MASRMNFNHLYYFHAVATAGSLSAAAKNLGVSQSTLSEQIRALEDDLGSPLFNRDRGRLMLNARGRLAYDHTSVMFESAERLMAKFDGHRSNRVVVEVGISSTVSRTLTADWFDPLLEHRQEVLIRIRHGDHTILVQDAIGHELDLLITDEPPVEPKARKLAVQKLGTRRLLAVAERGLAQNIRSFPADLSQVPYLAYTPRSKYRAEVDLFLRDNGVKPEVAAEADDVAVLTLAARRGLGFAFLPEPAVTAELERGELVSLGTSDGLQAPLLAVYRETSPSEFVLHLLERLSAS